MNSRSSLRNCLTAFVLSRRHASRITLKPVRFQSQVQSEVGTDMLLCAAGPDDTSSQLVVHMAPNLPLYQDLGASVGLPLSLSDQWRVLTITVAGWSKQQGLWGANSTCSNLQNPGLVFHYGAMEGLNYRKVKSSHESQLCQAYTTPFRPSCPSNHAQCM